MNRTKNGMTAREEKKAEADDVAGGRGRGAGGVGGSVFPVLLDGEAPFPGQMVVSVVVGELGLDDVRAAGQYAFGRLLHGGEELVLLVGSGPVAAHHVVRLVNCQHQERSTDSVLTTTRQVQLQGGGAYPLLLS